MDKQREIELNLFLIELDKITKRYNFELCGNINAKDLLTGEIKYNLQYNR